MTFFLLVLTADVIKREKNILLPPSTLMCYNEAILYVLKFKHLTITHGKPIMFSFGYLINNKN